jgi:phosphoribosylformylglycinamidine synthase subunit PurQ / glutaminase
MRFKLAIIQFPGSNCEYETARAAAQYGFETCILRWNCSPQDFDRFDGYILPGGFSFQDRIRAGVISSKLPIMDLLEKAANSGKPVLGICNGCQILAETGLIPNINKKQTLNVALAPNTKDDKPIGFVCDWVYVKAQNPQNSAFTRYFEEDDVLPIPVNNAEGKFILAPSVLEKLSDLTLFTYCSHDGKSGEYPITPNGSTLGVAGMCNAQGNVMGIMPHPERAMFLQQIPFWIEGDWPMRKREAFNSGKNQDGPWAKLFFSLKDYIKEHKG